MKKDVFGIKRLLMTTLIMILVMFAGLSTATLAWFSANNRVSAGTISFEARTADVTNLAIGWDPASKEKSIDFVLPKPLDPMVPKTAPTVDVTTFNNFITNFHTATVDSDGNFNSAAVSAEPTQLSGLKPGEILTNTFYIINNNSENDVAVSILSAIDGYNQPQLRVAVFIDGKFSRVLMSTPTDGSHYGEIASGANSNNFATFPPNENFEITISKGSHVAVQMLAWFDGVLLKDEHGGEFANFAVIFTGRTVGG